MSFSFHSRFTRRDKFNTYEPYIRFPENVGPLLSVIYLYLYPFFLTEWKVNQIAIKVSVRVQEGDVSNDIPLCNKDLHVSITKKRVWLNRGFPFSLVFTKVKEIRRDNYSSTLRNLFCDPFLSRRPHKHRGLVLLLTFGFVYQNLTLRLVCVLIWVYIRVW